MFASKLFAILYLWCAIGFWTWAPKSQLVFVDAVPITTKSSPVILDNGNSNSSQFVQIRSTVNQQPSRSFLVQQKNSLSAVQQTHILDDVQKNQRVHYAPSYNTGAGTQTTSSNRHGNGFPTGHQNAFEPATPLDDYANFNSLSAPPPPLQTLVLSPEQTLPTSPSFTNEYFSSPPHTYRQPSGGAVDPSPSSLGVSPSSSSSSHRIPYSTAPGASPVAVGRPPSAPASENYFVNKNNAASAAIQNYPPPIRYVPNGNSTNSGPANDQYPKYEPTLPAASFLPTGSKTKAYHLPKDAANNIGSHPYPHPHPQLQPQPPQSQPPNYVEKPKYSNNRDAGATANAAAAATSEAAAALSSDKFIKEVYLKMNPEILIAKDRQKFFQQLLEGDTRTSNRNPGGYRDDDIFALASSGNDDNDDGDADNDEADGDQTVAQNNLGVRNQFEKELLRQLKQASGGGGSLPHVGLSLAGIANSSSNAAGAVAEFRLPNGQKVQISKDYNRLLLDENTDGGISGNSASNKIKAIVVKQLPSTTPKTNLLEELTKGVVPAGAEFEVIKRNKDGALEEVSKLPQNIPQKKVTFVILEEQPDGTVRVQGVRGSEKESLKESGEEVDTIIKKIKEGELKLPPSTRLSPKQSPSTPSLKKHFRHGDDYETKSKRKSTAVIGGSSDKHFVPTPIVQAYTTPESLTSDSDSGVATTPDDSSYQYYSSPSTFYTNDDKYAAAATAGTTPSSNGENSVAAATILNQLASAGDAGDAWNRAIFNSPLSDPSAAKIGALDNFGLFHLNNSGYIASLFSALKSQSQSQPSLLPTTLGHRNVRPSSERANSTQEDDTYTYEPSSSATTVETTAANISSSSSKKDNFYKKRDRNAIRKSVKKPPIKETRKDNDEEESNLQETKSEDTASTNENSTLSDVLKKEGFYAMARFLRQSGLDSILNDTGPFTLFIPTDKAFRTLLIQLGGPDKAEEKFKENPRLLSGLLLHHVIPGAFRVNTLQDEMTGVSLAGTQLRVNTYTTHDIEWNDITVVTVNGAKILDEKDIVIPQGIAHAIDRVMFPLPVGNLLQSLQADRENRYSNFLKILEESELSYLLTGGKTFTLFAPLNRAFTHAEFTKILADANESKSFVLRHLVPGALYSAGMKYYQVRDSMEDGQQITLYKEAGKIKVNNAHVVTRNIPATNGVIHAIDAFL